MRGEEKDKNRKGIDTVRGIQESREWKAIDYK